MTSHPLLLGAKSGASPRSVLSRGVASARTPSPAPCPTLASASQRGPWCGPWLLACALSGGVHVCVSQAYKYEEIPEEELRKSLTATNVNLKVIPDVDWKPKLAQLVAYNLQPMKV